MAAHHNDLLSYVVFHVSMELDIALLFAWYMFTTPTVAEGEDTDSYVEHGDLYFLFKFSLGILQIGVQDIEWVCWDSF